MAKTLLFVCTGNMYRSQLAAQIAKQLFPQFKITSAGIAGTRLSKAPKHRHIKEYPEEWPKAEAALNKFDIKIWGDKSKPLTEEMARKADLIIVFDSKTKSLVEELVPNAKDKVMLGSELIGEKINYLDPYGMRLEQYIKTTEQIGNCLQRGRKKLAKIIS